MTPEQFIEHLDYTYEQALALVKAKNQDYGADSNPFKNFELVSHLGVPVEIGILTRLADKIGRIATLLRGRAPAVAGESLDDTIVDAINYLAILRAWLAQEQAKAGPQ